MALSGRQLSMTMKMMKSGRRHKPGSGTFEGHVRDVEGAAAADWYAI